MCCDSAIMDMIVDYCTLSLRVKRCEGFGRLKSAKNDPPSQLMPVVLFTTKSVNRQIDIPLRGGVN